MVQAYEDLRRPPSPALLLGLGLAFFLTLLLYTTQLRTLSPQAGQLRVQLVLLLGLTVLAAGSKVLLAATSWSAMWLPAVTLIIPLDHIFLSYRHENMYNLY